MTTRHRVLIVEDDKLISEELERIVAAFACDAVVVDNQRDAIALLDGEPICLALVDLHVKQEPDDLKGHPEVGANLVREIRARFREHAGICYRTPVVVVSGHASDTRSSVPVMRDGADDVIEKPFERADFSKRVRQLLVSSGRANHDACIAMASASSGAPVTLVIRLSGERDRRRTVVEIDSNRVKLTDGMLRVLLELIVGNLSGRAVHKIDLGGSADQGFRGISELKQQLELVLGDASFILNDQSGSYSIARSIVIETIDVEKLSAIGNRRITELAVKLVSMLNPKV